MADEGAAPDHQKDMVGSHKGAPLGVDPTIPSVARMYDYYLGGKDNYEADREAAEKALSIVPFGRSIARANRYFLMHAVLVMADQGITQYIDLGTGLPTSPSVHELARAIQPGAHVLYVDNDAVVTAHNRAILANRLGIEAIQADIRDPDAILANPELLSLIDFTKPVGVLFVAVLHFIQDSDDPYGIVRAFASRMVPGSFLALSHITSDGTNSQVMGTVKDAYDTTSSPVAFRTKLEIHDFFSGFSIRNPGLVNVTRWYPYGSSGAAVSVGHSGLSFVAGVGRKT